MIVALIIGVIVALVWGLTWALADSDRVIRKQQLEIIRLNAELDQIREEPKLCHETRRMETKRGFLSASFVERPN